MQVKLTASWYLVLHAQVQCSAEAAFFRHCHTNFENDAAKTFPAGHLAHVDFWPGSGL